MLDGFDLDARETGLLLSCDDPVSVDPNHADTSSENAAENDPAPVIRLAGPDILDDLEPLWRAIYGHHAAVAPELGALRPLDESWSRRRALYEVELAGSGFILVAERSGEIVAYVMCSIRPGSDIWSTGDSVGKVENMTVRPEERGGSIGSSLMVAFCDEFQKRGVRTISFEAMAGNEGAIDLFRRWGAIPTTLHFRLDAEVGSQFDLDSRGRAE